MFWRDSHIKSTLFEPRRIFYMTAHYPNKNVTKTNIYVGSHPKFCKYFMRSQKRFVIASKPQDGAKALFFEVKSTFCSLKFGLCLTHLRGLHGEITAFQQPRPVGRCLHNPNFPHSTATKIWNHADCPVQNKNGG